MPFYSTSYQFVTECQCYCFPLTYPQNCWKPEACWECGDKDELQEKLRWRQESKSLSTLCCKLCSCLWKHCLWLLVAYWHTVNQEKGERGVMDSCHLQAQGSWPTWKCCKDLALSLLWTYLSSRRCFYHWKCYTRVCFTVWYWAEILVLPFRVCSASAVWLVTAHLLETNLCFLS